MELSEIGRELLAAGRNAGPKVVFFRWHSMSEAERREHLLGVWTDAEWPQRTLGVDTWLRMFRDTGLLVDDEEAWAALQFPLRIFRGTTWGRRRNMAWTTDVERAGIFAGRFGERGIILALDVDRDAVLGYATDRGEDEVIVNPRLLPPITKGHILGGATATV